MSFVTEKCKAFRFERQKTIVVGTNSGFDLVSKGAVAPSALGYYWVIVGILIFSWIWTFANQSKT